MTPQMPPLQAFSEVIQKLPAMRQARLKTFPIIPINSSLVLNPREQIPSYLAVMRIGNVKSEFATYQILVLTAGIGALESKPL
jgi:hypothetical protein